MLRCRPAIDASRGRSRLRVHDEPLGIDEARLRERVDREDRCGRDAAGTRDQRRLANRFSMKFGQPIYRLGEQVGARMLDAVVFAIEGRIFQPEVCAEVDDLPGADEEIGHPPHGPAVRHRKEEEVAWFQIGMRREAEVRDLPEVRMGPTDRLASHRVRGDLGDFDLRVSEEEP